MSNTSRVIFHMVVAFISAAAIVLLFTLSRQLRTSKRKEDVFFRFLCIVELVYCFAVIANHASSFLVTGPQIRFWPIILSLIRQIVLIFFVQMWVFFVDISVNKSQDSLKRNYRFFFVPYIFLLLLAIWGHRVIQRLQLLPGQTIDDLTMADIWFFAAWLFTYGLLSFIMVVWYIVRAYKIVRYHKRERERPLFMKLELFIIPWVVAYVIELLPGVSVFFEELCPAISLLLTFFVIQKRYKYLDNETPFYNVAFIDYLKGYFAKRGPTDGCLMFIRGGELKEKAKALEECRPEKCMIFRMEDETLLMVSHNPGAGGLKAFEGLLKSEYEAMDPGNSLEISTLTQDKDENVEQFIKRAGL